MENREYLNNLFDIYKTLLTDIEQDTFINYYVEDLSLTEIAENRQISKASVSKTLKQVETKLNTYETKLKIYQTKQILTNALTIDSLSTIKKIITDILES